MLYKVTEWQKGSGSWTFNCVDNLASNAGVWYAPARILNMSPAEYIEYVIKNYPPENIHWCKDKCLVFFSWKNKEDMHPLVLLLNREARKKNFQI